MTRLLAIDFGTCNTSGALLVNGSVRLIKEPLKAISYSFPSSVYLSEQGEFLVGEAAENCRMRDIRRYRREFKRVLGQNQPYQIGDQQLKVEDVVAEVLKKLKTEAEKTVPEKITDVVITIPAAYKQSKRELMKQAAQAAGFRQISLLEEPVAAALHYAEKDGNTLNDGDVILIYDFGGGTFDATLIKKLGASFQVLGTPMGIENCGGVDFDRKIYDDMKERFSSIAQQVEPKEAFNQRISIFEMCIHIKHQLSEAIEASVYIPLGEAAVESYQLHRRDFDQMIAPFVNRTIQTCDTLLQEAGLGWQDVKQVLMVGGSCRIPYIKETLTQKLGREPLLFNDPELAVCMGAANINNLEVNKKTMSNSGLDESKEKIKSVVSILREISILIGEKQQKIVNFKSGKDIIPGLGYTSKSQLLNKDIAELEKGIFNLIVVGEFSHGKSTLINALLGEKLLPAKNAPATAIATILVYGDSNQICVYNTDKLEPSLLSWENFKEIYQLKEGDNDKSKPDKFKNVKYAQIERKYNLLAKGVRLIDSPGLKEDSIRTKITIDFLKESHAIIFLLNAAQLLNEDEQSFIQNQLFTQTRKDYIDNQFIQNRLENVFFVINKFDQIDEDEVEEIQQRVKLQVKDRFRKETGEFDEKLYQSRVFFVSAKNALKARQENDSSLLENSAIPKLEGKIEEFLASPAKTSSIIEPIADELLLTLRELYKDIPQQKKALDQPLNELEARYNENKERFKKLQDLTNSIDNTIRGGGEIKRKIYDNLRSHINDLERNWSNDSRTFIRLEYISTGNIWDLVNPFTAEEAKRKLNNSLTTEIKEYIKIKLGDWSKKIPGLISSDLEEMSEELTKLVSEFQIKIDEIKIVFSGGNAKDSVMDRDKMLNIFRETLGSGAFIQGLGMVTMLEQIIGTIVTAIANMLVTIISAIITGIIAIIVLLIIGIIPAIIVAVIGAIITLIISWAKPFGNKPSFNGNEEVRKIFREEIGKKLHREILTELANQQSEIFTQIQVEFDKIAQKMTDTLENRIKEVQSIEETIIRQKQDAAFSIGQEKTRIDSITNEVIDIFSDLFLIGYNRKLSHDEVKEKLSTSNSL